MTEVRSLVLTDVVDSTKLAAALGEARNGELWDAHDRLARELVAAHRGLELERTDGIMVLFASPTDALAFALAYHRALRALDPPLVARAGMHVGELAVRENPPEHVARGAKRVEVDGLGIAVVARVMSVAVGGQTLLTSEALAATAPDGLRVASHGHWRMKGVPEPVELFEVGDDAAPFTPPPDGAKVYRVVRDGDLWVPVKDVRHSLPAERDAFVGREADLLALARLVEGGARLVSVLGVGGTGKTRLAVRYGRTWLGEYPGGAWFCDLSEARDADGIVFAVAKALEVPLGREDPVVQLGHAIAARGPCLVILDNLEQVARHAPGTLGRWLDRAPEAVFVATSREVLGLPGEQALPLAPLPLADGAALFVARARASKPDFVLAPDDVATVASLVKLLDCLPLAIELAAARVRVMSPALLLQRMDARFKVLASTGGRHTRQATLRATLDWSWDLLTADEQSALAQLSVFAGGFTLEAAEAVLSLSESWPMDAVQALVDKSLVQRLDDRFDLLVSVQEYGWEKLGASGRRAATEGRHGAYFAGWVDPDALRALDGPRAASLRRAWTAEVHNFVAALRGACARADGDVAVRSLRAVWALLSLRGPMGQACDLAEEVLGRPELPLAAHAVAHHVLGVARDELGRGAEAEAHQQAALAAFRALGDRRGQLEAITNLAFKAQSRRKGLERSLGEEGLALAVELDDAAGQAGLLNNLGMIAFEAGDPVRALDLYGRALALARRAHHVRFEANILANLANLHWRAGRPAEALTHVEVALVAHRQTGNLRGEGVALTTLAAVSRELGGAEASRDAYRRALAIHRQLGARRSEPIVLGNMGGSAIQDGDLETGRALLEVAVSIAEEVGDASLAGLLHGNLGFVSLETADLPRARHHLELAAPLAQGSPIPEGATATLRGRLALALGDPEAAAARYDEARAIHAAAGYQRGVQETLRLWGELELLSGRLDAARARLAEAEALARALADPAELAFVRAVQARLERDAGRIDAAEDALADAEGFAARTGLGPASLVHAAVARAREAFTR